MNIDNEVLKQLAVIKHDIENLKPGKIKPSLLPRLYKTLKERLR